MNGYDIEQTLKTMTILVDTREQQTAAAQRRWEAFGFPYIRATLNVGDYSAIVKLPCGEYLSMADRAVIERKMSIDEIATCCTSQRARFIREFERAKEKGIRIYLLVENCSWEAILAHKYKSQMTPSALIGSLIAFESRYDCKILFCKDLTTARLVSEILRKETKERLKEIEYDG